MATHRPAFPAFTTANSSGNTSRRDSIHSISSQANNNANNPFATPFSRSQTDLALPNHRTRSVLSQRLSYLTDTRSVAPVRKRKFKSARLKPGEFKEKPWLAEPNPRRKWEKIILWGCIVFGFLVGAIICVFAYQSVTNLEYCLVFEDDFKTLDKSSWSYEIQRGGFGSGSFEWSTDDPKNSYVDAEGLHIVPTLTTESTDLTVAQINDGHILNLTTARTCTSESGIQADCSIRSNITSGAIINPVRSARLNTRGKKTITYGRVEVVAKLPKGDWLWPAIWMMPEPQGPHGAGAYGPWPASGEIDIMESRGNAGQDYPDGRDSVGGTLHWGPVPAVDAFYKTSGKHNIRRSDYSDGFHTYGLEWNDNYLFTYIDTRLSQVLFTKFSKYKSMWDHGDFGGSVVNKSALNDPWSQTGRRNTPFDQPFYLILNVAVGATNGFFKDGVANKPWGDQSLTAPREFWSATDQWLPTWGEGDARGMTVKSVRMWKEGACGAK